MSLTSEDLRALRNEFVTKDDLKRALEPLATKLEPLATKEDLAREVNKLREDTAQNSADLRRYMEILIEDQSSKMKTMFDGLAARMESI